MGRSSTLALTMETGTQQRQTCYRHPNRETGVSCSNCGRPICPDCMTSTSVGMRCPDCARQTTKVRAGAGAFSPTAGKMPATIALIAVNVIVFIIELAGGGSGSLSGGGTVIHDAGLSGPDVANGDWWRVITGGFLHAGFLHLLLNMYVLYVAGSILEPGIGTPRFLGIYFVSLIAGLARGADRRSQLAHRRRVRSDLRADGRGGRDRAGPRR